MPTPDRRRWACVVGTARLARHRAIFQQRARTPAGRGAAPGSYRIRVINAVATSDDCYRYLKSSGKPAVGTAVVRRRREIPDYLLRDRVDLTNALLPSPPHATRTGTHVYPNQACRRLPGHLRRKDRPGHAFEQREQAPGYEARAGGVDMAVSVCRLSMREK